ncbi:hypothetical protein HMI54_011410 [Coelomomyces lativittatus]|nr:hypothetical protein HMI54_011410 [Coelomomyces lativittatus]
MNLLVTVLLFEIASILGQYDDTIPILLSESGVGNIPVPTAPQIAYQNYEIGAMVGFNMESYSYNDSLKYIPNIDEWVKAASYFKAKYAVLTAKHDSGFCIWPTTAANYTYSVKYTKWGGGKRDIVSEFIQSCKKYNVKPAVYYSIATNFYQGVQGGVVHNTSHSQQEYNELCAFQLTELLSSYGEFAEIWFDGGLLQQQADLVVPILKKYQPNTLVFNAPAGYPNCVRWIGNENGNVQLE